MENTIFIDDLRNGEEEGLVAAYRLYRQPLLFFVIRYVVSRETTEDIVAEVYVKAWNARYIYHREANLQAYLYTAAKIDSLNYLRNPHPVSLEAVPADFQETGFDEDLFSGILRTELI